MNDYVKSTTRIFWNGLRFRCAKLRNSPLKPAVLSLAVTNRCNSHCIMCNIWKRAAEIPDIKSRELSGQQIIDLLSAPLFSDLVELDLTGGETHLRSDLVDIVTCIARLKPTRLPALKSIIIASNGFLTERLVSNYEQILMSLKNTDIDLVSVNSFDGFGETHDRVRGTPGAFKLVSETLKRLMELRQKYPNLIPGIKTTILHDNIGAIDDILDFALANNLFHIISPVLFTERRFRNTGQKDDLILGREEYRRIRGFYSRDNFQDSYFYNMVRSFLAEGKKRWDCTAMYNYAFIDYDGMVYPCEIISQPLGNIKEQDFTTIWNGPAARRWRKKIGKTECCRACHEPGMVRYSAVTGGISYLKFLLGLGRNKYHQSLQGEGFTKYLHR